MSRPQSCSTSGRKLSTTPTGWWFWPPRSVRLGLPHRALEDMRSDRAGLDARRSLPIRHISRRADREIRPASATTPDSRCTPDRQGTRPAARHKTPDSLARCRHDPSPPDSKWIAHSCEGARQRGRPPRVSTARVLSTLSPETADECLGDIPMVGNRGSPREAALWSRQSRCAPVWVQSYRGRPRRRNCTAPTVQYWTT